MSGIENEPWVGTSEVALHLGVKVDTVRKMIKSKTIPCHRVGKLWKFKISEIDTWVKSGCAGEGEKHG